MLIAVESSTAMKSVAFWDGSAFHQCSQLSQTSQHHAVLFELLEQLIASKSLNLDTIAGFVFGQGPGASSGIRLSLAAIQGMAAAKHRNVLGVSSLEALAQEALLVEPDQDVVAAAPMSRDELFWAAYRKEAGSLVCIDEGLSQIQSIVLPYTETKWHMIGAGWHLLSAALLDQYSDFLLPAPTLTQYPKAEYLLQSAISLFPSSFYAPEKAQLSYVRTARAWKTLSEQLKG